MHGALSAHGSSLVGGKTVRLACLAVASFEAHTMQCSQFDDKETSGSLKGLEHHTSAGGVPPLAMDLQVLCAPATAPMMSQVAKPQLSN